MAEADANPYAPPVAETQPLRERFPNPDVQLDRGKVLGAGITLIVMGGLQLLAAAALAMIGLDRIQMAGVIAVAALIEGTVTITLGIFTLRNSYPAAVTGLVLSSIGLALALISINPLAIGIRVAIVVLVYRGVSALKGVNLRIAAEAQPNPLTAYYHHFVPLLARVMAADGHLDRRERAKIVEVCDAMNISSYEQRQLIERAAAPQAFDVAEHTRAYAARAREIGLVNPQRQLLVAAIAVAGADGVIVEAEGKMLREIGAALGTPADEVDALVEQQRAKLAELTPELARKLLNVQPDAPPEHVKASYEALRKDLEARSYEHLGHALGREVAERRAVVERAYQLLQAA
jgi:tellurite resistance protein